LAIYQPIGGPSKLVGNSEYTFPVPGSGNRKHCDSLDFLMLVTYMNGISKLYWFKIFLWICNRLHFRMGPLKFSYAIPLNTDGK
jgi:outer membrane protein insertion porin family